MGKKLTTKDWIAKAVAVHGDRYDYSLVEYTGAMDNMKIICKKHGEFIEGANNHLKIKGGCSNCKMEKRFINRAIKKHGNKYDYSNVNNLDEKVEIICEKHGSFFQSKKHHLRTNGCEKCGVKDRANKRRSSFKDFVKKANVVHGNKYSYIKFDYKNIRDNAEIFCSTHGSFTQNVSDHLCGSGCPKCSKTGGGGFDSKKPAILYYLKVEDFEGNKAYKIGITNRTVAQRYGASDMAKITVLSELEFKVGLNAYKEEQRILKEFADQKWDGVNLLKSGNTELFNVDVLGLDK